MPVQRCAQCGTARRGDLQVCVRCEAPFADTPGPRPATPSTTQSHGTVLVAVLAGFVLLGVLLYLSVRGVGPFQGRVLDTVPRDTENVAVTVEVSNKGDKAGHGKCSIARIDAKTGDRRQDYLFLSERVAAHSTVTQLVVVPVDAGVTTTGAITC